MTENTEPRYTLAEFRANLVTPSMIAERLEASDVAVISNWAARYDDWPEPVLAGAHPWYWWPEVEVFTRERGLPKRRQVAEQPKPDPANLVIVSDIANRLDVAVSTVATWPDRYDDWPAPLVLGAQQKPGSHGRQAVYWWPEILAFLARHDLPGGHPGVKRKDQ